MNMFCSNCGQKLEGNSKFCHACGAKVSSDEKVEKVEEIFEENFEEKDLFEFKGCVELKPMPIGTINFKVTTERIQIQENGLLKSKVYDVKLEHIENIEIVQSLKSKMFNVSSLIVTCNELGGEKQFDGIENSSEVFKQLTQAIESKKKRLVAKEKNGKRNSLGVSYKYKT